MSLIYFLFLILFYGTCCFAIYWLLKHFVSDKPWHQWVRYGVWLSFVGLLTFDTIYYKIVVVDGLCAGDKTRVYPAPPASYVVAVASSKDELKKLYGKGDQHYYIWPCESEGMEKYCVINNIHVSNYQETLLLGNKRDAVVMSDASTGEVYSKFTSYPQSGQWLAKTLFGIDFVFYRQPDECRQVFFPTKTLIQID